MEEEEEEKEKVVEKDEVVEVGLGRKNEEQKVGLCLWVKHVCAM